MKDALVQDYFTDCIVSYHVAAMVFVNLPSCDLSERIYGKIPYGTRDRESHICHMSYIFIIYMSIGWIFRLTFPKQTEPTCLRVGREILII
jgi:hypothetical protein